MKKPSLSVINFGRRKDWCWQKGDYKDLVFPYAPPASDSVKARKGKNKVLALKDLTDETFACGWFAAKLTGPATLLLGIYALETLLNPERCPRMYRNAHFHIVQ